MTIHERELTGPVDLCTPDGRALNPAAKGWSRTPLHRANLDGCFGRNKRWDYRAILAGDLAVSTLFSNVDTFGAANVRWADMATGATGGQAVATPPGDDFVLPERPGTAPLTLVRDEFTMAITDDDEGTHLTADWAESDGERARLDVAVALPPAHESVNVVIPWDDTTFNFTSKHQARPATGEMVVGDARWAIGGPDDDDA